MKEGEYVIIKTKEGEKQGLIVPSVDLSLVTLKLDSGYNILINKKDIISSKIINQSEKKKEAKIEIKNRPDLKNITILHTGGTIASRVDYKIGGVSTSFTPENIISMFPELKDIANIKTRLIRNMWSQDMRFSHYNLIAKEIEKEIKNNIDGIIISQGTDTIHYTSAALSFILENLPVPVLIVGAQRSSDRGSSDAYLNLINAVYFISNTNFAEVGICMHESADDENCLILPGTKSRKMHTSRRDAFKPINTTAIANVNYKIGKIEYITKNYNKISQTKLKLKLIKENIKVAIIKQHVNMYAEQFKAYENYDGLVIEATGLGCLPISETDDLTKESGKIFKVLKDMIKRGIIIVESPQTIFGRINLNVYEDQRNAQEVGILGHLNDMTTETTFIKLAWLLSNYKKEEVKNLIMKDLRKELSNRTEFEKYFLK
jgi:glutamyl-tRNA(Gln) amidotransferase subunit D